MQLRPLYRVRFDYPKSWSVALSSDPPTEEQHFLFAEGSVEGTISGKFRGANNPRRRPDRTAVTDFRGVIETEDGAVILFEYHGFGRPHTAEYDRLSPGGRQWVATAFHWTEDPRYRRLNDTVCVGTGQVRPKPEPRSDSNPSDLILDLAELIWEPIPE